MKVEWWEGIVEAFLAGFEQFCRVVVASGREVGGCDEQRVELAFKEVLLVTDPEDVGDEDEEDG